MTTSTVPPILNRETVLDKFEIIARGIKRRHNDNYDSNDIVKEISEFLLRLREKEVIDEFKLAVNFFARKIHVKYTLLKNIRSMTLSLAHKEISEKSFRIVRKD